MTAIVLRGDARRLPLPDGCVDLIVTSPPFLNLRSFTDGGRHYDKQIGTGTLDQFLADLWEITAEMARVLKPTGSIFVELGDSYTDKSLNDAPFRYAIGCRDKLGLLRRTTIVWHHVNGLPESATDRVRSAHSYVFHLVKQPRYYAAVDEIREPHAPGWDGHASRRPQERSTRPDGVRPAFGLDGPREYNPLGKLPGSVWNIPSAPLTVPPHLGVDHFAAFPPELPRRIILGWSPPGICTACGEGRRPVSESEYRKHRPSGGTTSRIERGNKIHDGGAGQWGTFGTNLRRDVTITGYACACTPRTDHDGWTPPPTRPALVLDPFGGTGTTALVAAAYGRTGITIDMSADYSRLAAWRVNDPAERARAMHLPKPPPIPDGQASLFDFDDDPYHAPSWLAGGALYALVPC